MSRIGKKPIEIPTGVTVEIQGSRVKVQGPKGTLERVLHPDIVINQEGNTMQVHPDEKKKLTPKLRGLWGLSRTLIQNMLDGVTKGYEKKLELEGVGYRATMEGNSLVLNIGFSHPVKVTFPEGVQGAVEKNVITVAGIDKEQVGEWASRVRAVRPVEPYKGKGIKYEGEVVRRKEGKRAGTTA